MIYKIKNKEINIMLEKTIKYLQNIIKEEIVFDDYAIIMNEKIKKIIEDLKEIDDYLNNDIW